MTDAKTAAKIALLETTLSTNADVLSAAQVESLKATIANLKATGEAFPGANAARMAAKAKPVTPRTAIVRAAAALPILEATVSGDTMRATPVFVNTAVNTLDPGPATKPVATVGTMPTLASLLTGGKFDASSPAGKVFTFEIAKPDRFRGEYFASVFNAEQNRFLYVGMMKADGTFRFTTGSKLTDADVETKVLRWALGKIVSGGPVPNGYTITARTTSPKTPTPRRRGWSGRRPRWTSASYGNFYGAGDRYSYPANS